jgi:hypothetical protein
MPVLGDMDNYTHFSDGKTEFREVKSCNQDLKPRKADSKAKVHNHCFLLPHESEWKAPSMMPDTVSTRKWQLKEKGETRPKRRSHLDTRYGI